jgi:hypothetical protein
MYLPDTVRLHGGSPAALDVFVGYQLVLHREVTGAGFVATLLLPLYGAIAT